MTLFLCFVKLLIFDVTNINLSLTTFMWCDCSVVNAHLEQLALFWFCATSAFKILFIPEIHAFLQHSPNNSIFIIILLKELKSYSEGFNPPIKREHKGCMF